MSSSGSIMGEVQAFELSVKKLSDGIGSAGSLWRDAKFQELGNVVRNIALQSRDLMASGERCCTYINQFESIASERY